MTIAITPLRAMRTLGLLALLALAAAGSAFAQTAEVDRMNKSRATVRSTGAGNATGEVQIQSRISRDPDFGRHKLIVLLDLSRVTVTKGKTTYTTAYQEEFVKPLGPSQTLVLDVPVTVSTAATGNGTGSGALSVSTIIVQATMAMNVDTATGAVTSATATIASQ